MSWRRQIARYDQNMLVCHSLWLKIHSRKKIMLISLKEKFLEQKNFQLFFSEKIMLPAAAGSCRQLSAAMLLRMPAALFLEKSDFFLNSFLSSNDEKNQKSVSLVL